MVIVCCCQCDPRLAAYGVSILSFFHFLLESILLYMLDDEHRLVAEDSGIKFLTVFITNLYLMFTSILLFFAALYLIRALCIPWLIGCAFNLLIYFAMMVVIILRLVGEFTTVEAEKLLFTLLQMGCVIFGMWIIINFMIELNNDGARELKPGKKRSMFKLYSEDETDVEGGREEEDLFPAVKQSRRLKEDRQPLISN